MLTINDINSIYADHVNQASQEKQQRVNNIAADITGSIAAAAAAGQRAYFVKTDDIPRGLVYAVIDALTLAGFTARIRLINGCQKIMIRL
jgi:hypothetical protein